MARSPSSRRAWIEIFERAQQPITAPGRPPRGGRGLKWIGMTLWSTLSPSPSSRRAWIEIQQAGPGPVLPRVALLAEGVD